MPPSGVYIDSSLLVLLVVGETDTEIIAKHKRTKQFQVKDYERLAGLVNTMDRVLVTPNTLTEASNLLGQHREPERSRFFEVLNMLIMKSEEIVVSSEIASQNEAFKRLGLADAALLEVVSNSTPVVTTDLNLYLAASGRDSEAAFNFWHYQSW